MLTFIAAIFFLGGGSPKFLTDLYKCGSPPNTMQSLAYTGIQKKGSSSDASWVMGHTSHGSIALKVTWVMGNKIRAIVSSAMQVWKRES